MCRKHGGGAVQVKRRAAERLYALAEPAITALGRVLSNAKGLCTHCGRSDDMAVVVRAAQIVLDRTGHGPGPGQTITVERHEPSAFASMTPIELARRAEQLAKELRAHEPKRLAQVIDVEVVKDDETRH